MLIIRKLHREFPRRVVEWGMSYILLSWGAIVLLTDGQFAKATEGAYQGWNSLMPQHTWGFMAFSVGMARLAALYVNGAHLRSPIARTACGFLSMFIWFFVVWGIVRANGVIQTGIAVYPWLMAADAYAVYTAAGDAYQSQYNHNESKGHAAARA